MTYTGFATGFQWSAQRLSRKISKKDRFIRCLKFEVWFNIKIHFTRTFWVEKGNFWKSRDHREDCSCSENVSRNLWRSRLFAPNSVLVDEVRRSLVRELRQLLECAAHAQTTHEPWALQYRQNENCLYVNDGQQDNNWLFRL